MTDRFFPPDVLSANTVGSLLATPRANRGRVSPSISPRFAVLIASLDYAWDLPPGDLPSDILSLKHGFSKLHHSIEHLPPHIFLYGLLLGLSKLFKPDDVVNLAARCPRASDCSWIAPRIGCLLKDQWLSIHEYQILQGLVQAWMFTPKPHATRRRHVAEVATFISACGGLATFQHWHRRRHTYAGVLSLSLIHISEPTRLQSIAY